MEQTAFSPEPSVRKFINGRNFSRRTPRRQGFGAASHPPSCQLTTIREVNNPVWGTHLVAALGRQIKSKTRF
jgi:hypothetical protein